MGATPNGVLLAPGAPGTTGTLVASAPPVKSDRGAAIIGIKMGALLADAFNKLGPSFLIDLEAGYLLPWLNRSFAVTLDLGYSQPTTSGENITDPRIVSNNNQYSWDLTQRELMFGMTFLYRATFLEKRIRVAPYVGVGPRLWLLQTRVSGSSGAMNPINLSTEQSTKIGVSVPVGVDVHVGPGRVFGELQVLWAPIDHRTTGDSSVGSITLTAGYRLLL
jgi:hypothetical protein